MKIFKNTVMLFMILTLMPFCTYAEEEQKEIEGLHEALNSLLIEKCFTPEELKEMNNSFAEWYDNWLLTDHIPGWKWLHPSAPDEEAEELYQKMKEDAVLDFSRGVKISTFLTKDWGYIDEYGLSGKLKYLFSSADYWSVPGRKSSDVGNFKPDGELIGDDGKEYFVNVKPLRIQPGGVEFLKDEDKIKDMLIEAGISKVYDMKIFSLGDIAVLYIDTDKGEYEISLFYETNEAKDDFYVLHHLSLYTTKQFTELCIESTKKNDNVYRISSKPTFETEAQSLQAEGLLYGNENGLDLLKPLTRIEAAAMLLRALGESETAENSVQVFSDVPDTHWGFGAAANAHALGLIYGIGDNLFAPDRRVTAEEFSTMVLRAAGENEFDWQNALNILIERNIITKEDSLTMDFFTRGDMAKIIYEIKANGLF